MSGVPVEKIDAAKIRCAKNTLRRNLAEQVRNIYKSWGMSDTRFCKYMGEELCMSTERVRLFLSKNRGIHKELMEPGKLPEILERIFPRYIADERVNRAAREKARELWAQEKEQHVKKINEIIHDYSLANTVGSFKEKDYDIMSTFFDDIARYKAIYSCLRLIVDFQERAWPENPEQGLSYQETEVLRQAISAYLVAGDYLKYMRKKYKNYK